MQTIKGPALFLGQFAGDVPPFNSWDAITRWAADQGYVGVQVPAWAGQLIDLGKAAASKTYCDEFKGVAAANGVEVTELATHLQGQLVAVHPAYDEAFDGFAAPDVRGNPKARQAWAVEQVKAALTASRNMGLSAMATFSGSLAWPYAYPWPQRPAGLVEAAFDELARRGPRGGAGRSERRRRRACARRSGRWHRREQLVAEPQEIRRLGRQRNAAQRGAREVVEAHGARAVAARARHGPRGDSGGREGERDAHVRVPHASWRRVRERLRAQPRELSLRPPRPHDLSRGPAREAPALLAGLRADERGLYGRRGCTAG